MEMNLHMPQDAESEAELKNLAAVPYQIISPANNASIIGIYQDSMLGSYRFTRENITFTKREAMNLLMMFNNVNTDAIKAGKTSNFDILSQILPPLSLKVKNKQFDGDKEDSKKTNNIVEIKDGNYLRGQIDKGILGSGTKGIIHRVCNDFGNMASSNFIDDLQNIITEYMKTSSFSVGISDLISDNKTNDEIVKVITNKKIDVKNLIDQTQLGVFENNSGKTNQEEFETKVNNILNQAASEAGKIGLKSLSTDNRFVIMVNAGSKGSDLNISQMISCLGQQNVDGKRIPYGFEDRTLPHYTKYDDSPASRGFVESSYINGLSPQELFFHAMGGRVGLIDTAVKSVTWETPIVIIENSQAIYTEIGKWIDNQLDAKPEEVQHFTERQMELLNINEGDVYIPTTDENGIVTWGEVTAITRHDPGTELYEIKTVGGRSVIVTESKSLLIWNEETKKLKEMPTPEIKVGDSVPVTKILCTPPVITNEIDMSKYLPKSEYIYGTDFNIASEKMHTDMKTRNKIPSGWWNENNGKVFTLPYSKKASLQRTNVRSNINNIKNGHIYPFHATKTNTLLPDKFALNEENGIFIGLFLSEGNAYRSTVNITNNNECITSFVKNWFDKHNIYWVEKIKINKIGGLTTTISGNCCLLGTFLKQWLGHKAENKYIPSDAFIAPEEFIIGLLNGYFSGDGSISKNSIDASSASKRLIEGINMLCSRFGIFGKTFKSQLKSNNLGTKNIKQSYRLSIRSQWGKIFSEKITLLENIKNVKLRNIVWNNSHRNFQTYNDVVLDKIVEINIIDVKDHPKVYDLTIPSTLNFGLANGLQVRDTSSTGYIQRRLIKGLEDLMVNYDMTIRTNKNKIVQFSYGDDNFDTIKVENQELPIGEMSIQDVYAHYNIPEENKKTKTLSTMFIKPTLARYRKQMDETNEKCKKYTDFMLEMRDKIVKNIFNNKEEKVVRVPVAFSYIINNIIGQQSINSNSLVDITPLEAFEMIEDAFKQLEQIYFANPNLLFKVLYFYYLSPKDLLFNKRFNRKALEILLETIILTYKRAIVAPGEMVGMIAAQSIGEPTTQLTLNSVTYETLIIVRNRDGVVKKVSIGDFTEENMKIASKSEYYKDKDTTYAELNEYYEIPSCDEDGNVVWKKIEAVTRHPVINKDGSNTMLKITTKEEREVIATKAKSFLKLVNGKIVPVDGDTLKVGDYLPVSKKCIDFKPSYTLILKDNCVYSKQTNMCEYMIPEEIPLDYNFGYLIGAYAAEGCMTNSQISISNNDVEYFKPILELCEKWNINTKIYKTENKSKEGWTTQDIRIYNTLLCRLLENLCGKLSHNKFISDKIIFSNKECLIGFLDAYIGGDGYVNIKQKIISISSVSQNMLIDVQQILNILDTYSYIKKYKKPETNNRGTLKENIKQLYNLIIPGSQLHKFASILNIKIGYKQNDLMHILKHKYVYNIHKNDTIVPDEIDGTVTYKQRLSNECKDILFDKIKSIEEVSNTTNYAYDLTIEGTRTFNIYNSLAMFDTFHFAGVASKSNVTRGVPRIEEILSLSAELKNPSLTVFLKPEDETDKEKAHSIMYMLEHTKLQEVVKAIAICFDPDDLNTLIEEDKDTMMQYREFENLVDKCLDAPELQEEVEKSKWIIRMEMNPEIMLEKNITMDDINFTLNSVYQDEISCVYSDFNSDKLVFRIRMNNILKQNASKNSALKKGKVNPLDQSDQIYILKNFQDQLLQNIVLRGIKKINKVILRKIKDNMVEKSGSYTKQEIWVLDTIGTNLLDVLGLDYIDSSRTISNDIIEIFNVLGIEAARKTIYNELADVIEFDGTYLNYHHMALLCDRMTANYKLVSIFRHGINNDNIGPIAKASFEETPEMFLKAARHAELDTMRGVSANVMCGQEGFVGTSAFQVVLDIKEMSNLEQKIKYEIQDAEESINKDLFGKFDNPDDPCSKNKLSIDNNVVNIKTEELGDENDDYNPFV